MSSWHRVMLEFPAENFSLAVEHPRQPFICRLVFTSYHFLLDSHIYRYSMWIRGVSNVRSMIDWTSLQDQGRGKIFDRAINIKRNKLAWTFEKPCFQTREWEERPFVVEFLFFAWRRNVGEESGAPIGRYKRFADTRYQTRHSKKLATLRAAIARLEKRRKLWAPVNREIRSALSSFLLVVPNINPRQRCVTRQPVPRYLQRKSQWGVHRTPRESARSLPIGESASGISVVRLKIESEGLGKALGLIRSSLLLVSGHVCTLGAASVDRVSRRLVPRATEWFVLFDVVHDKSDRPEARAVLDWRDGRLKATEQGRSRGFHRASRHRPPRRWKPERCSRNKIDGYQRTS